MSVFIKLALYLVIVSVVTGYHCHFLSSQLQKATLQRNSLSMTSDSVAEKAPKPEKRRVLNYRVKSKVIFNRERNPADERIEDDPLIPQVEAIVAAADDRKAHGITVLRVKELTEITHFMIVVEGNSRPQSQAIALSVEDAMAEKYNETPYSKDGKGASGWILLDYGQIMVHVMTPQTRNFYKLEKRWQGAELYDVSHLVGKAATERGAVEEEIDIFADEEVDEELKLDEEDPFWK